MSSSTLLVRHLSLRKVTHLLGAAEAKDLASLILKVAADGVELIELGALQQGSPMLSATVDVFLQVSAECI